MVFIGVLTPILAFLAQGMLLNDESSPELHAIYLSLYNNVFGIFFAWLILAFESGTHKWIDNFVLHKLWKPLGKLTFCIYMVHPVILSIQITRYARSIDFDADYIVFTHKTYILKIL